MASPKRINCFFCWLSHTNGRNYKKLWAEVKMFRKIRGVVSMSLVLEIWVKIPLIYLIILLLLKRKMQRELNVTSRNRNFLQKIDLHTNEVYSTIQGNIDYRHDICLW